MSIVVGVIVFLILLSALFSGSETALTAVSRARMHQLAKSGDRRAGLVSALLGNRDRIIIALLLSNNLVNILASALATSMLISTFGDAGVLYATLLMTILILIFAEVVPKIYAASQPDRVSLNIIVFVRPIIFLTTPITNAIQTIARAILRIFRINPSSAGKELLSVDDELRGAIDLHHREGTMVKTARDMLGGILNLRELSVSDVMVHRTKIIAFNADDPPEETIPALLSSSHTRIPLWRGKAENIIGVLHAKDVARILMTTQGDVASIELASLASAPWFVPETTHLHDQLNAFLKRNSHFALVVDEYGEVMGLITLEDILEEIVGDIVDEHDASVEGIQRQPDGSIILDGSIPIRDLNRAMDWDLPDEEATTIAGLVIHEARMIPEQGQALTFHGFRFQVMRRQRNRLTLLRVVPLAPRPHGT